MMRRWLAVLLVVAAMIAFVGVPTPTGIAVASGLLLVAFVLFATGRTTTPFERMVDRRRGAH